jgi:hypothetical protein
MGDRLMRRSVFLWQLYISTYTLLGGIPLLFFPNTVLPVLGFQKTNEPWVHASGMFLIALSYLTFMIYWNGIGEMVIHIIVIRIWITIVLLALGFMGFPPFLFVLAGVVLIGVIGTSIAYKKSVI